MTSEDILIRCARTAARLHDTTASAAWLSSQGRHSEVRACTARLARMAGLTWREVGEKLGMDHRSAMRAVQAYERSQGLDATR